MTQRDTGGTRLLYRLPMRTDTPLGVAAGAYIYSLTSTGRIKQTTAREYRHALSHFSETIGRGRRVASLTKRDTTKWERSQAHNSPNTRRHRWQVVDGFLDWLVREGVLAKNPFAGLKPPPVPEQVTRALNAQRARALFPACSDQRARVIVVLGLQLGLRRAEIAGLQLGNVDWATKVILVKGKGGHERMEPLTEEAEREILAYLAEYPASAGPLIRSYKNPQVGLTPNRIWQIFNRVAYDAGVKLAPRDGVSTHAMRHTAATDVWAETKDVRAVQAFLGHKSLATTERYIGRLDVEYLREAVEGRRYTS